MARALKQVDARTARQLMDKGALMVDVREPGEYAQVRIPGSQNIALSRFEASNIPVKAGQEIVFFCAGGNRTAMHAGRLSAKAGDTTAYVMQGGISAWASAGLPVERGSNGDQGQPRGFFSRLLG
jgi:rhodanese-related sulfurtransferase